VNHSHVLDPFVLALYAGRPLQFMITEPALFDWWPARVVAWTGQVPKRKLESDTRSVRLLKKWGQLGGTVVVFPEGRFPWDGRLLPLQPGLSHLVQYLDLPVVTVRQINGDRFWPPWAAVPRRTSLRYEIDPPIRFGPDDDIEAEVTKRLTVDLERCPRFPVTGKDLARGLARLLAVCPSCGARHRLVDEGDELRCDSCQRRWSVGTDNVLRGDGDELDVGAALRRSCEQLQRQWTGRASYRSAGTVLVMDASGETWSELDEGTLTLDDGRLRVGAWTVEVSDVLGHTIDWGNLLLLRTRRQRLALAMPADSRAVWTFAIEETQRALPRRHPERPGFRTP
jgi:hypothetical protein